MVILRFEEKKKSDAILKAGTIFHSISDFREFGELQIPSNIFPFGPDSLPLCTGGSFSFEVTLSTEFKVCF